jgi:hypothetical protein
MKEEDRLKRYLRNFLLWVAMGVMALNFVRQTGFPLIPSAIVAAAGTSVLAYYVIIRRP